ncbi:MAG: tRNA (adenosine(37)-N6)-threonylcarbamoyltransferase complex dimerization subunit type 1 TsaB [Actinomycetota bacterium]|nr:tRNA (adenosine(37)-N6)-threonylcarbamoyltransferase complex dimerization subunit type 1 TsaB [Actinomycetota bacterium]
MLLGIETAAGLVGVALADADRPIAGAWLLGDRRHAEALAPAIDHVLSQAGVTLGDVDAIAVDVGPGLFTGLRVGVATAQGLAEGLGIGIVEVTSVEVLAREAYGCGWKGPVAAVVDARRGEVFVARCAGERTRVEPPSRCSPSALAEELASVPGTLVVGTGAQRYAAVFAGAGLEVGSIAEPSPRVLVEIAAGRLGTGAAPVPPAAVRPVYLREADARINWVQR